MAKSRSLSLVEASASKCGEISTIKCVLLGLLGADRSFSLSTMRRASVSIRLSCKAVTWALAVRSRIGQQLLFIQRLGMRLFFVSVNKKVIPILSALIKKTPDPGAYHLCIWRFLIDLYLPVYPIYGNIKVASHPFGKTLVSLKLPL